MKRINMMFVAGGVWLLGATSAAALTVDLTRPLTPRVSPQDTALVHTTRAPARMLGIERPALSLPPITIVARAKPPRVAPSAPAVEPMPDVSRMNCAPWRDLQMGSGRVQVCE